MLHFGTLNTFFTLKTQLCIFIFKNLCHIRLVVVSSFCFAPKQRGKFLKNEAAQALFNTCCDRS